MRRVLFLLLMCLSATSLQAERTKDHQSSLWFRYMNIIRLPHDFRIRSELENRMFLTPAVKEHQWLFRNQAEKHFKKGWHLGLGFVFFANGANDPELATTLLAPELRPYLEAGYRQPVSDWFNITHRYRAEWRFLHNVNSTLTKLEDGYRNFFRFRYQLTLEFVPYKKDQRDLRLRLADEVMLNAGKIVGRNIFDQNRLMAGVQFNVNEHIGFEAWYIFWMQQQANGDNFFSRQILRLGIVSNFDLSDKKKKTEN